MTRSRDDLWLTAALTLVSLAWAAYRIWQFTHK
jgi:hypothetical protein